MVNKTANTPLFNNVLDGIMVMKLKRNCLNCTNVDMCIFRMKVHTEFSGILRNGISFNTLDKIYTVMAKDCTVYKKQSA